MVSLLGNQQVVSDQKKKIWKVHSDELCVIAEWSELTLNLLIRLLGSRHEKGY